MLFHLLYPLSTDFTAFNIFRYITFRSMVAFLIASTISILWGKSFIDFMKRKQFGQIIRNDGPESHYKKAGTPTMGGVVLMGSIFFALGFCGNFDSWPLNITALVTISFFILGFLDDYFKVLRKNSDGVSAKGKLLWQFVTGILAVYLLLEYNVIDSQIYVPFLKEPLFDMGKFYILFGALVIVGSSNAVNLTDGLDGLAIGPILTSALSLGVLAYAAGHKDMSAYLYIPYIDNAGELAVAAAAIIGAGVGFLWYNSYPAQIFMG
ncbi:MAG: phospho-N-acetylmuramoyl-pentapeptide-transferase, partial [Halobacteriovoraceae bacterium]|nr:phospho-N-acetylmuramoyl-pentapeptide-transferase [Halobacteriovoraceae bacterium]